MKKHILTISTIALIAVGGIAVAQQTMTADTGAVVATADDSATAHSEERRGDRGCDHRREDRNGRDQGATQGDAMPNDVAPATEEQPPALPDTDATR